MREDDYPSRVVGLNANNENCSGSVRASKSIHERK